MPTTDEVHLKFVTSRDTLSARHQELSDEYGSIRDRVRSEDRRPTPDEERRLETIAAERDRLNGELATLAVSTIDELENAEDIDALVDQMKSIGQRLETEPSRVKEIVSSVEAAGKVLEDIVKAIRILYPSTKV